MSLPLILPEIVLFSAALLILMIDVFSAKKFKNIFYLSHFLALVAAVVSIIVLAENISIGQLIFNNSFLFNQFTSVAKIVTLMLLALYIIISLDFVATTKKTSAEFLALILLATTGGMILISANDLLVFYLGLELQALPLYILAAFNRESKQSAEAGIKYFILGSLASGLLLFGISLIYGFSGTVNFSVLNEIYRSAQGVLMFNEIPVGAMLGFILVLTAMFFKVSAAPFHMWSPDVYQGSPTIVTNFFATVVKFTTIIALTHLVFAVVVSWPGISKVFLTAAILSIAIGSFGAIYQKNFKRLLAYSSISHVGFILFAMLKFDNISVAVCVLYAIIYAVISLGSFAFLNLLKEKNTDDDVILKDEAADRVFAISSLSGLAKTNPVLAASLAALMFSSAGIPPLAGFFSKFYVLKYAVIVMKNGMISFQFVPFVVLAVLFSVISAFYYLRIVKIMYFDEPSDVIAIKDSANVKFVVLFSAIFNIALIFFIGHFFDVLKTFTL